MPQTLNDPLELYCVSTVRTLAGTLQKQPAGMQKVWGHVKSASPLREHAVSGSGARTFAQDSWRARYDLTLRTQAFAHKIEKIKWQNTWLTPLMDPQPLADNPGYLTVPTTLLPKESLHATN